MEQQLARDGMSVGGSLARRETAGLLHCSLHYCPNVRPTAVSDVLTDVHSLSSFCRHLNLHNTQSRLQTTLSRSVYNRRRIFSKSVTHNTEDRTEQATCFGRLSFIPLHVACFLPSYILCMIRRKYIGQWPYSDIQTNPVIKLIL
jgi:hypothetical protein